MSDAVELKKNWGDQQCDHPELEKEYDMGFTTGDYVCTQCGLAGWGSHWNEEPSLAKSL